MLFSCESVEFPQCPMFGFESMPTEPKLTLAAERMLLLLLLRALLSVSQIETPTETIPVIEHLTAARFRSLWADLPRKAVLTTQV